MIMQFVTRSLAGNTGRLFLLTAMGAALLASPAAAAGGPPSPDAIATVTPQASDGLGGSLDLNIPPTSPANQANVARYEFSINNGGSVKQRLPIEVCSSAHANTWVSYKIGGNATGALQVVTVGSATFLRATEECQTINIDIDTGTINLANPNVVQILPGNINLGKKDSDPNSMNPTMAGPNTIQIRVTVFPVGSNVACYMTDSSGNFLLDVNGDPVDESESNEGLFGVVVNAKNIEVATNPGQFYFNFVYANKTANLKTVTVDMRTPAPVGVVANGRNAVHHALFGDVFDPTFQASFNCANDGSDCYSTPWGATGLAGPINVPPHMELLVTYHLEWTTLKKAWNAGCPGDLCTISVTGVLSGDASGTCEAGASGTMKP